MSFLSDVGLDQFDIGLTKLKTKSIQCLVGFQKRKPIQSANLTESNHNWIRWICLNGLDWILHAPNFIIIIKQPTIYELIKVWEIFSLYWKSYGLSFLSFGFKNQRRWRCFSSFPGISVLHQFFYAIEKGEKKYHTILKNFKSNWNPRSK